MRGVPQAGGFTVRFFSTYIMSLFIVRSFVHSSERRQGGCNENNAIQTTHDDEQRGQYRLKPIRKADYFLSLVERPKGQKMYRNWLGQVEANTTLITTRLNAWKPPKHVTSRPNSFSRNASLRLGVHVGCKWTSRSKVTKT